MMQNLRAAVAAGANKPTDSPFLVTGCGVGPGGPYVPAFLTGFFRPGGLNPAIAVTTYLQGGGGCVNLANTYLATLAGFNAKCNPAPPTFDYTGCVPFSEMYANYSNGTSDYHGFSANLRKRFSSHYEFLASYTWAHAIDDSTDLQATVTPQDNYIPGNERSNSVFDQRQRFVFSGVYQTGKLTGSGFASKFFRDWTLAPLVEIASGRPFNIITGVDDNLQLESKVPRPNVVASGTPPNACGYAPIPSKFSPKGFFQEACIYDWNGQIGLAGLVSLDGNLGRNAGRSQWNDYGDFREPKKL